MADTIVTPEVTVVEEENKQIPYKRFAEVVSERKALETKLASIEAKIEADNKAALEKQAKSAGDYDSLITKVTAERLAEKQQLQQMVSSTFLTSLANKQEILNDKYLKLFDAKVEVDGLEIKNASEVEKLFTQFRLDNPTLFKPLAPVPAVNAAPVTQVKNVIDTKNLSKEDMLILGLKEQAKALGL